ncbi:uncharacterized protein [Diabrotica undecimpunctata]|uniref:uncharacterized protein n=1 Tax=Diabrotica undecimpunctata TaxID=50387 RepID=UPI003B635560
MWGSKKTFGRGKTVEAVLSCNNTCLMNSGASTYFNIASGTYSSIDLSICDPKSADSLSWYTLDSLYDSNHFPIVITNSNKNFCTITKWNIATADWNNFQASAEDHILLLQQSEDIDEAITLFNNCIIMSAENHVKKITICPSKKAVPWWNSECELTVRQCKTAFNRYRKRRTQENPIYFKKLRAKAKYVLKKSKKDSWQNFVSTITSDTPPSKVWIKIRQMKGHKTPPKNPVISLNGNVITDNQKIAQIMAESFAWKFRSEVEQIESPNDQNIQIPLVPQSSRHDIDAINLPFTQEELALALSSCTNSAAGPDNIPIIFIKNLSHSSLATLLNLYNKIWHTQQLPKLWRESIIIPIKKSDLPSNLTK